MKVFNARHFLRHIGMPTLQYFAEAHPLGKRLSIDWALSPDLLPATLSDAIDQLGAVSQHAALTADEREAIEQDIWLWQDDLQRAYLMSNSLATQEFRSVCADDPMALAVFQDLDEREIALWMLTHRDKGFRDVELHLAFLAKTNGRYWKKHRIQSGLCPSQDRTQLEAFCQAVAQLYKKAGAGDGVHVEFSERQADHSIQLTLYVEGPVTALTHFSQSQFNRITTRIALETALVYYPGTGIIETIVKGGGKVHTAVLALFGEHVVQQVITPEEIEKPPLKLNALRDSVFEPTPDWSSLNVQGVRVRRARFSPSDKLAVSLNIEASADQHDEDAVVVARQRLRFKQSFEVEYTLDRATVTVYRTPHDKGTVHHFSFDLSASGASTITNLSIQNQPIAQAVLVTLGVIDADDNPLRQLAAA